MLQKQLEMLVSNALSKAVAEGLLPAFDLNLAAVEILNYKRNDRADFACALPAKLAPLLKLPAIEIAEAIAKFADSQLTTSNLGVKVAIADNGFINFYVSAKSLAYTVYSITESASLVGPGGSRLKMLAEPEEVRVQYAWHRLSAALRQLCEPRLNFMEGTLVTPCLSREQFEQAYVADMRLLEPAFAAQMLPENLYQDNKKLALLLDDFGSASVDTKNKAAVKDYLLCLSELINGSCVLDGLLLNTIEIRNARIGLIGAAKRVFGSCLGILNMAISEGL